MPISNVAADEAVKASTIQQLINHVNASPGRQIFTSNGTFTVPAGVYRFKVTLCGGGGQSGTPVPIGDTGITFGNSGGTSPLCSKIITGQEIGTSFAVTVGGGSTTTANGGTSSFGALLSSTGGGCGDSGGADGTHTGEIRHSNLLYLNGSGTPYGFGGAGSDISVNNGTNGIVIVEW